MLLNHECVQLRASADDVMTTRLVDMALDVANGMSFLEGKGIVHGALSASVLLLVLVCVQYHVPSTGARRLSILTDSASCTTLALIGTCTMVCVSRVLKASWIPVAFSCACVEMDGARDIYHRITDALQ